jgi:hypothetical protein
MTQPVKVYSSTLRRALQAAIAREIEEIEDLIAQPGNEKLAIHSAYEVAYQALRTGKPIEIIRD